MREKLQILLMIGILVCVVIGSHKAGEYLYGFAKEKSNVKTAGEVSEKLVIVDAGHGGKDPGKVGINDALEKDINLKISLTLKKYLEEQGITVVMTREDGEGLASSKVEDLKKRVALINEKKPVLTVSVHQNSYPDEQIHGAQVFYFTHSKTGETAAKLMQEALLDVDPENKRQAKANDTYYMLKKTETPVIIVECGFLSNRAEADLLITEDYQQKLAKAITKGVMDYISSDKE